MNYEIYETTSEKAAAIPEVNIPFWLQRIKNEQNLTEELFMKLAAKLAPYSRQIAHDTTIVEPQAFYARSPMT